MKILLTGGSGLLGKELQKHLDVDAPSHKKLNINDPYSDTYYDLIIHAAGYTDVVVAEKNHTDCFTTNVLGTLEMVKYFMGIPFIYISSEYAHNPVNYYSETKLAGEAIVKALCDNYLIIRTLFKPRPFPWKKAFLDQYTQGDYVDVIAKLIAEEVKKWNQKTNKTVYVGTGRKSMFALAMLTNKKVKPISVHDIAGVKLPKDYI